MITCPCGHPILADTEDWKVPRCFDCATDDGLTDYWICDICKTRPYGCVCHKPKWVKYGYGPYSLLKLKEDK